MAATTRKFYFLFLSSAIAAFFVVSKTFCWAEERVDRSEDKQICGAYLRELQRLSLQEKNLSSADLGKISIFDPTFFRPGNLGHEIEDLVLKALDYSPRIPEREKVLSEIQKLTGLGRQGVLDLLSFYVIRVWESELDFVEGNAQKSLARLLRLGRIHFLLENPLWQERFNYFRKNLGRLSVVEMAKERSQVEAHDVSQSEIYAQVRRLGLSFEEAYAKASEFESKSAEELGMSYEAYEFARHFLGVETRGFSWARSVLIEGSRVSEEEYLIALRENGLSLSEMAQEMERVFGREPARTEAAIQNKISELWLRKPSSRVQRTILRPPFGLLMENGEIISEAMQAYLMAQFARPLEEIAKDLDLPIQRLRNFLNQNHFPAWSHSRTNSRLGNQEIKPESSSQSLRARKQVYEDQELELFLDPDKGALDFLGTQEPFEGGFTVRTSQFFHSALQWILKNSSLQWNEKEKRDFQEELQKIALNDQDGGQARSGIKLAQIRVMRALDLIRRAGRFSRPLHIRENYLEFIRSLP